MEDKDSKKFLIMEFLTNIVSQLIIRWNLLHSTYIAIILAFVCTQMTSSTFLIRHRQPYRWSSHALRNNRQVQQMTSLAEAAEDFQEAETILNEMTNSVPLPWSCDCEKYWRDLGVDYYPRYVHDGRCRSDTCWFGHFRCVPLKYELGVIKRLTEEEREFAESNIHSLSEDLVYERIEVTAGCQCKRGLHLENADS